jgi:iron(III) transport system permease protein
MARLRRFDPSMIMFGILIIVMILLVAGPIGRLLYVSIENPETGGFTLNNYAVAYGRARYVTALLNSLMLGGTVCALGLAFAVPLAWAVSRTDMPGRSFVRLTVLGAFMIPPYLGAVGWMLLAGPNAGWLNRAWMWLTGSSSGLFDIYSFAGLALVIALSSFPYIYVFVSSALELVSSELEDAASILGSGPWRTTMKVTLPLVMPAIIAGVIVCFLESIALFGTPALIALPARFNVVTTQLWQFFEFPTRVEVAAAYSMPLLVVTVALFGLQKLLLARRGYVAVSGKGGERRPMRLGKLRWVVFGYCFFVGLLAVILPLIVLLQAAFAKAWGRGFSFDNVTLRNFIYILIEHDKARASVFNSFQYGATTACIAIGLALAIAYVVNRKLVPYGGVLSFLCMAPFVIPGIVLAIGFYATYAPPPLALYGTSWILILAFVTRFLPIAYANSDAAIKAINPEMEEAVRILGGSRMTAIRKVVAPLLKKSLAGGWLLVFIPATRELSAAIFLVGPNTRVMSVLLYDLSEEGNFEQLAALGTVLLAVTLLLSVIGFRVIGRDFMLRRG